MSPEERTVLRALAAATRVTRSWAHPERIARETPAFMSMTASGRRQPMGERRVRHLLARLEADGMVERRRASFGFMFRLTDAGRAALPSADTAR